MCTVPPGVEHKGSRPERGRLQAKRGSRAFLPVWAFLRGRLCHQKCPGRNPFRNVSATCGKFLITKMKMGQVARYS